MKQKSGPIRFRASVVALLAIVAPLLRADETLDLPAASLPVERVIDQLLEAGWKEAEVKPAAPADDFTWLRRVTLDLTGRIPTGSEVAAFVAEQSPGKRAKAVDALIASPRSEEHTSELQSH